MLCALQDGAKGKSKKHLKRSLHRMFQCRTKHKIKALQKRYKSVTKKRYIKKASSLDNPCRKSRYEENPSLSISPHGSIESSENGRGGISPNESGSDPTFDGYAEAFINAYPKKGNKESRTAIRAWYQSHKPTPQTQDEIMRGLNIAVLSDKWRENEGQYIPAPQNFLTRELWWQFLPPDLPDRQSDLEDRAIAERDEALIAAFQANPLCGFPTDQLLMREFNHCLDPDMKAELKRRREQGLIDEESLASFEDWKQKGLRKNIFNAKTISATGGAN